MAKGKRWARMLIGLVGSCSGRGRMWGRRRRDGTNGGDGAHRVAQHLGFVDGRADLLARRRAVQRARTRTSRSRSRVRAPATGSSSSVKGRSTSRTPLARSTRRKVAACEDGGIEYIGARDRVRRDHGDGELRQLDRVPPTSVTSTRSSGRSRRASIDWTDANALSRGGRRQRQMPIEPLAIVAPGEESGTYEAFIELSGIPRSRGRARGRRGRSRGAARRLSVLAERQRDHPGDARAARTRSGSWASRSPRSRRHGQGVRGRRRGRMRRADGGDDDRRQLPARPGRSTSTPNTTQPSRTRPSRPSSTST